MTDFYPPLKYHKPTLFLLALSLSYLFQSYARHNNLVVKEEAVDSDSPIPSDKGTMEEGHMKQHKSIDSAGSRLSVQPRRLNDANFRPKSVGPGNRWFTKNCT